MWLIHGRPRHRRALLCSAVWRRGLLQRPSGHQAFWLASAHPLAGTACSRPPLLLDSSVALHLLQHRVLAQLGVPNRPRAQGVGGDERRGGGVAGGRREVQVGEGQDGGLPSVGQDLMVGWCVWQRYGRVSEEASGEQGAETPTPAGACTARRCPAPRASLERWLSLSLLAALPHTPTCFRSAMVG